MVAERHRSVSAVNEYTARSQLALACLMIAFGGLLLGLQLDANGQLAGTGLVPLGIGAVVALAAGVAQAASGESLPRDSLSVLSAVCGFSGVAFLVSGVLAPGGSWMFFEVALLLWIHARRGLAYTMSPGAVLTLAAMFLFRLWITYQGSQHRWEVLRVDVPVVSWIQLPWLEPIQSVSLGAFTPQELGLPAAGVNFQFSSLLWSLGIALCATGLWWRAHAARENENDRVSTTIRSLPPSVAFAVEKLLPEGDWREMGLHGLGERRRRKRIEELVHEKIAERRDFDGALRVLAGPPDAPDERFARAIHATLARYRLPAPGAREVDGAEPEPPPQR